MSEQERGAHGSGGTDDEASPLLLESGGAKASGGDLFNYSLSGPFKSPSGWATWALIGVVLSPLVVGVVATGLSLTEYESAVGGRGTVDGVAPMITMDFQSFLSLLSVTGMVLQR